MTKRYPSSKVFSKEIVSKRYQKNLSQEDLAELIDCHINTIMRIENGISNPPLTIALKLSKVLNISLDEIIQKSLEDLEI